MSALHIIYYAGIALGIIMFTGSWLIRRQKITEGILGRAEKPLLLAGAGFAFIFGLLGFTTL